MLTSVTAFETKDNHILMGLQMNVCNTCTRDGFLLSPDSEKTLLFGCENKV